MAIKDSIFDSCMHQIMKEGDQVNIQVDIFGDVEITFRRKNGNFGTHTLSYDNFIKYFHNLDSEAALSDLVGKAYNNLLGKEGAPHRLMV